MLQNLSQNNNSPGAVAWPVDKGPVQHVCVKGLTAPCDVCMRKGLVTCWPKVMLADVECLKAHASMQVNLGISLHGKTAAVAWIAHTVWIVVLVTQLSKMLVTSCCHAVSHTSEIGTLSCSSGKIAARLQSSCISPNEPGTVKQAPLSN